MEIYFNDLSSKRTSVDSLVDDAMRLVHGIDDLANQTGQEIPGHFKEELAARLDTLKRRLAALKAQAILGAKATGRAIESKPYVAAGIAFSIGLLIAAAVIPAIRAKNTSRRNARGM